MRQGKIAGDRHALDKAGNRGSLAGLGIVRTLHVLSGRAHRTHEPHRSVDGRRVERLRIEAIAAHGVFTGFRCEQEPEIVYQWPYLRILAALGLHRDHVAFPAFPALGIAADEQDAVHLVPVVEVAVDDLHGDGAQAIPDHEHQMVERLPPRLLIAPQDQRHFRRATKAHDGREVR